MKRELCPYCGGSGRKFNSKEEAIKLVALRKTHQALAYEVAFRLGFTPSYICDLEHGRRPFTAELAEKYRQAVLALKTSTK
jgi:predicted transcriptional regulator